MSSFREGASLVYGGQLKLFFSVLQAAASALTVREEEPFRNAFESTDTKEYIIYLKKALKYNAFAASPKERMHIKMKIKWKQ